MTRASKRKTPTSHGEGVTFDGRVKSILYADVPGKAELVLKVQDRTRETLLKAIIEAEVIGEEMWQEASKLTPESIIRVTGLAKAQSEDLDNNHDGKDPAITNAIAVTKLTVIARASSDLPPFSGEERSKLQLEERLQNRILDVRSAASGAIFKLHSGMCQLIVEFLCSNGFHWIHTPRIITATISGDNEYFRLPYFGRDAYLAQSTQHHKQMALSMDMERVFEIGPVFRAEVKSSASTRHLTEFTVLDIGMAFRNNYYEVVEMIESMLLFVFKALQERKQYVELVEIVRQNYPSARKLRIGLDEHGKVPRISFQEAKRLLKEELGVEGDLKENFTPEEEAALGVYFRTAPHLGQTDIFTIDQYPASMRQFNSQPNAEAPGFSNTWDTIVAGREICSGSQRINGYDDVCDAMRAGVCGPPLNPEEDKWKAYLSAFKAGMPKHGGCGLGVNRLLQGFLGLDDVREVTLFPRDVNRLVP